MRTIHHRIGPAPFFKKIRAAASDSEGDSYATNEEVTGPFHNVLHIGRGTTNDPSWLGIEGNHPTHGAITQGAGTDPNHAVTLQAYDTVNFQQATYMMSPHSYATATTAGGHNGIFAGSWHEMTGGAYCVILGGGGGSGQGNRVEGSANKSVILGGQDNTLQTSASHSAILGGANNVCNADYSTLGGLDGISPFDYTQAYGMDAITANGDANWVRFFFRGASTGTSQVNIQGPVNQNIPFRAIPFNEGAAVGINLTGKLTCLGVSTAGASEGNFARYEMDMGLTTTGTQGATSGWTALWQDGATTANSPAMTRTDTGGGLTVTAAPILDCNATGVFRIQVTCGVSDRTHWLAVFDGILTAWAT